MTASSSALNVATSAPKSSCPPRNVAINSCCCCLLKLSPIWRPRCEVSGQPVRRRGPVNVNGPIMTAPCGRDPRDSPGSGAMLAGARSRGGRGHGEIVSVAAVKAAVLEHIPGELVIDDVQIGTVGPHEVLVRTAAAGLVSLRPPLHGGQVPASGPGGARARVGRRRRGGRRRRCRTCSPAIT